jgi:hypothetical protein
MFNKHNLALPPGHPLQLPIVDEQDTDSTVVDEFVASLSSTTDSVDLQESDSIVCYHLKRFRSAQEGADYLYGKFSTKHERLRGLTRLNMLVTEDEDEESAADVTDIVGTTSNGRISTKGGLLLNHEAVLDALDRTEARRAVKAAETARKDELSEQRCVVVKHLQLYKYVSMDDDGSKLADPLRHFLRDNHLTGKEWKGHVNRELVPRLFVLFQDPTRTWQSPSPPPPPRATSARHAAAAAPPTPARIDTTAPMSTSTGIPASPASTTAAGSPLAAPPSLSTPIATVQKRKRRQRAPAAPRPLSRAAELCRIQEQCAVNPHAPRSRRARKEKNKSSF